MLIIKIIEDIRIYVELQAIKLAHSNWLVVANEQRVTFIKNTLSIIPNSLRIKWKYYFGKQQILLVAYLYCIATE